MQAAQNSRLVRFGSFEVDLQTRELYKRGLKIKLQEQPFLVLARLLECPGQLVTRDEIRAKLWPRDTFVDFDHALNAAVRRLREALDDNAGTPRFVETLSRRGYRFIAPVQTVTVNAEPQQQTEASARPTASTEILAQLGKNPSEIAEKRQSTQRDFRTRSTAATWLVGGMMGLLVVSASIAIWKRAGDWVAHI